MDVRALDPLATLVASEYAIGVVRACEALQHNLNDIYAIEAASGRYIFRVYDVDRREADIRYETRLLRHVGRLASGPVARINGEDILRIDGGDAARLAVLFMRAEGTLLTPPGLNESIAATYGEAVGDLHNAMDDFSPNEPIPVLNEHTLLDTPLAALEPLVRHRIDDAPFMASTATALRSWLNKEKMFLPTGVCHGDLQGGNGTIAQDGAICFFDFERCGIGWRAYDVAVFRWGAAMGKFRLGWSDAIVDSLWEAYLRGYKSQRSLTSEEIAATTVFVALRHLWYLGLEATHAKRWSAPVVDDTFWDREISFLRDWIHHRWPDRC